MVSKIAWFKDLHKEDIPLVGGKGANLGEMYNIQLPIPPGFIVTAQTYKEFVEKTEIQSQILEKVKDLDIQNTAKLQETAKEIQNLIISTEMPEDIQEEVIEAYEALGVSDKKTSEEILKPKEEFVAARSSATAEDLPEASFAGQQATFLNVKGKDQLIKAVRACWASLFTARAIYYRTKNNFPHEKVFIAVVVQKMVNSDVSGVMFTANPATDDLTECIIEAVYGLGEGIVSGAINPDHYIVDKDSYNVKQAKVKEQTWGYYRNLETGKTEKRQIPDSDQGKRLVNDKLLRELTRLGKKIEEHYGRPQDIEWAIEKEQVYIVQSRAITTLKNKDVEQSDEDIPKPTGKPIVTGMTAARGEASGPVKIIKDIANLNKVEKGDILVTTMTTPDMVPAMEKAAGIVTDEGGQTCFTDDTKVLTNYGIFTIKEIYEGFNKKIDFKVLTLNEKTLKQEWQYVNAVMKRQSEVITVSVSQTGRSKQNSISLTPDHKMLVFENRNLIRKPINTILETNDVISTIDKIPVISKSSENEQKFAYLMGAIFTDGNINLRKTKGSVSFIQKETELKKNFISTVTNYFKEVFNYNMNKRQRTYTSTIRNHTFTSTASSYVCHKKSIAEKFLLAKEHLVSWVMAADIDCVGMFLGGVIDGDGSFNTNHGCRLHIYSSNPVMTQAIVLGCLRFGIQPVVQKNRENCKNIQITENISKLLKYTKRVNNMPRQKIQGTKLFSAKQL
ncbi:PEP/pyruvate-binding domain-containing protein, partial [Nanoarchaeota archaeon]